MRVTEQVARQELARVEALREGHYIGNSGGHLDTYVQKDKTITQPDTLFVIGNCMAELIASQYEQGEVDALVGIAPCSSQLATVTAKMLGNREWEGNTPSAYFAEKVPSICQVPESVPKIVEDIVFKRGFDKELEGKNVILVEDVLTTGGSMKKLIAAAQKIAGLNIVGGIAEFNRAPSQNTAESLGLPRLQSLISQEMPAYAKPACPMCEKGVPINTDLGHGAKYLAEQANQKG